MNTEEFLSKIDKRGPDECWEYTGTKINSGYGRLRIGYRIVSSHRYAWELANGPIPKGKMILHKCDNRACCNPAHLYCGTHSDNNRDTWKRNTIGKVHGKFTVEQISMIRKLDGNASLFEVADIFNCDLIDIVKIQSKNSRVFAKEGYYI